MPTKIIVLKGKAAEAAVKTHEKEVRDLRAELDRRGAKTYEAVVLLPNGKLTSAVDDER
jgi:hypothetical protein